MKQTYQDGRRGSNNMWLLIDVVRGYDGVSKPLVNASFSNPGVNASSLIRHAKTCPTSLCLCKRCNLVIRFQIRERLYIEEKNHMWTLSLIENSWK